MSDVDVDEGARLRHIAENDLRARRVAETELAAERNRGVKYPLIQRQLPNEKDRKWKGVSWSYALSSELKPVWQVARGMKAARLARAEYALNLKHAA